MTKKTKKHTLHVPAAKPAPKTDVPEPIIVKAAVVQEAPKPVEKTFMQKLFS